MAADQLFIGRLPRSTRTRELEDIFYKYGRMTRCDVKQGLKMSYGFIEYEDMRDAEDAIHNEHGREMGGSRIVVEWARGPKYDYRQDYERHRREKDGRGGRHDDSRDRRRRSHSRSRDRGRRDRKRSRSKSCDRRRSRSMSKDRRRSDDRKSRSRSHDRSRDRKRSHSKSPDRYQRRSRSKSQNRERSRSKSLDNGKKSRSRSGDRERDHSRSPDPAKKRSKSPSGSPNEVYQRNSLSRSPEQMSDKENGREAFPGPGRVQASEGED